MQLANWLTLLTLVILLAWGDGGGTVDLLKLKKCVSSLAGSITLNEAVCSESTTNLTSIVVTSGNGTRTSVDNLIENYIAQCLEVEDFRTLRIMVPNVPIAQSLIKLSSSFEELYNIPVKLVPVDVSALSQEVIGEATSDLKDFSDGWIVDPSVTGDLAAADGLADLTAMVRLDSNISWTDVTPFYRQVSAIYDGKIVGVPLDGDHLLMYYRRDLFDQYNIAVPLTWEEFTDIAVRMNGTDTDGDGVGDLYGVCLDNAPGFCKGQFILAAVLAPYIQFDGTQQGFYFDPPTMKPLFDNSAMATAVRLYRELFRIAPKNTVCMQTNPYFRNGSCLMTINFGDEFKVNAYVASGSTSNQTPSNFGVSRVPGSTQVLNRSTGLLMACTDRTVCPYADEVVLANGSTAFVNFAPFGAFGGWTGMVNNRAEQEGKEWAYRFFSYIVQPSNSWYQVLDPSSGIDPYRNSQIAPSSLGTWEAAGYDRNATASYLAAVRDSLNSPNMVLDIRLQAVSWPTRLAMLWIEYNTTWALLGADEPVQDMIDAVIRQGQQMVDDALSASKLSNTTLRRQYCQLIGCTVGPKGPAKPFTATASNDDGLATKDIILASVLLPLGAVVLAVLVGWVVWRRAQGHRQLLRGIVKAPMAGPQTTLLITDIQDSTSLWEAVPEDVMDAALRTHHAVVRKALSRHNGYESATEGDSFILAFHTPTDALACAMRIQTDLLSASWQPQLLRCVPCDSASEVWLAPCRGTGHSALLELLGGTASDMQPGTDRGTCPFSRGGGAGGRRSGTRAGIGWLRSRHLHGPPSIVYGRHGTHSGAVTAPSPVKGLKPGSLQALARPSPKAQPNGDAVGEPELAMTTVTLVRGDSGDTGLAGDAASAMTDRPVEVQQVTPFGRLSTISAIGDDEWHSSTQGIATARQAIAAALSTNTTSTGATDAPAANRAWAHAMRAVVSMSAWLRFGGQRLGGTLPDASGCSPPGGGDDQPDGFSAATGGTCVITKGVTACSTPGGALVSVRSGQLLRDRVRASWVPVGTTSGHMSLCVGRAPTARQTDADGGTSVVSDPYSRRTLPESYSLRSVEPSADGNGIAGGSAAVTDRPDVKVRRMASNDPSVPVLADDLAEGNSIRGPHAARTRTLETVPAGGDEQSERSRPQSPHPYGTSPITALSTHSAVSSLQPTFSAVQPQNGSHYGALSTGNGLPGPDDVVVTAASRLTHGSLYRHGSQPHGVCPSHVHPTQAALRQLAFRGLRVRMGIHSGVPEPTDVSYNQAEARYHYSGVGMSLARAVQGAAAGGQVLLSDSTFACIRSPRAIKQLRGAVVLHMGEHQLDAKMAEPQQVYQVYQVYQALPRQLLCRLYLQPPLKVTRTVSPGALEAPTGRVAVAFMTATGVPTLLAWNAEVTRRALSILQDGFAVEASRVATGAYIAEATSGLLLATFGNAADALSTCLSVQSSLLTADWPAELLKHDMCEQVTTVSPHVDGTMVREVLFRGLRVKAGVDWGSTRAALNAATGRIAYRGRVMNRASRISSQATSGQVLCSKAAWQAAVDAEEDSVGGLAARGLTALSLGSVVLKGVTEPVEILEVTASPGALNTLEPPASESFAVAGQRSSLPSASQLASLTFWAPSRTGLGTGVGSFSRTGANRSDVTGPSGTAGAGDPLRLWPDSNAPPVPGSETPSAGGVQASAAPIGQRAEDGAGEQQPASPPTVATAQLTPPRNSIEGAAPGVRRRSCGARPVSITSMSARHLQPSAGLFGSVTAISVLPGGGSRRASLSSVPQALEAALAGPQGGCPSPVSTLQVYRLNVTTGIAAPDVGSGPLSPAALLQSALPPPTAVAAAVTAVAGEEPPQGAATGPAAGI